MPLETAARLGADLSHSLQAWSWRLRPPRTLWPYVLMAAALIAVSEILWLWHSWPVRQVLDRERLTAGVSV